MKKFWVVFKLIGGSTISRVINARSEEEIIDIVFHGGFYVLKESDVIQLVNLSNVTDIEIRDYVE
jgi:hypothetical protein